MTSPVFTAGTAPGALPGAGHAWHLAYRPVDFLSSLHAHGDLVEIRLGPRRAHVLCHPELLHHVLTHDRAFDKEGAMFERLRDTVGNGVGTCPYADHRRQRRQVQPFFLPGQLAGHARVMEEEIDAWTSSWRPGQVLDVHPSVSRLGLRVAARAVIRADLDAAALETVERSFETVLGLMPRQLVLPPAMRRLPTRGNRRYRHAMRDLRALVDRVAAYRDDGAAPAGSLVDLLALGRSGADPAAMDGTQIQDQAVSMLLAGSETSATTLAWALVRLTRHPEAGERLRAEAGAVLGGRTARFGDLPRLPYTSRVLTETLRLHPPGWFFPRKVTTETTLAGRRLAPGTILLFSPLAVQYREDAFPRPRHFDPDRWHPDRDPAPPRNAYVTFGAGARGCPGRSFALNEACLALATLAGRWRFEAAPGTDVRPVPFHTGLRPRRLLLRLTAA
jgi:pentalenene oxygenase